MKTLTNTINTTLAELNPLGLAYEVVENAHVDSKNFNGLHFSGSLFSLTTLSNVAFESCVFFGSSFENCNLENCTFIGCSFEFSRMDYCMMKNCTFIDCQWKRAPIKKCHLMGCELDGLTMDNVLLSHNRLDFCLVQEELINESQEELPPLPIQDKDLPPLPSAA